MKKIVILGPAYPYRGGNAIFTTCLFRELSKKYDTTLINYSLLYPNFLFPGTTQFDLSQKAETVPSERLINSINPFSWYRVARRIKSLNPDLVVFDWWNPFFGPCHFMITLLMGKKFRRNTLVVTENVISHEGRWIDRVLTKIGLANASSFIALSGSVEKQLDLFRGDRKVYRSELPIVTTYEQNVVTNKIEARKKLGYLPQDKILLFFGYVREYKGLDVLIRAFPLAKKTIPELKLLIVGEFYDSPEKYMKLIRELDLTSDVKVVNEFVPNENVGDYYAPSDVVVLPYKEATQSGILKIAYGFEKPVIVTDVGGLHESVEEGQTGFTVKANSPEALADGIGKFYSNDAPYMENIRKKNEQNSFKDVLDIFEDLVK